MAQFVTLMLHCNLHGKFRLNQFILSPVKSETPQILPHFQDHYPVVAPPSGMETSGMWVHKYKPSPIQQYQNHF